MRIAKTKKGDNARQATPSSRPTRRISKANILNLFWDVNHAQL